MITVCFHVSNLQILFKLTIKISGRIYNLLKFSIAVIACVPEFPSYLSALLPRDQVFDEDDEAESSPSKKKKEKEVKKENDKNSDGNIQTIGTFWSPPPLSFTFFFQYFVIRFPFIRVNSCSCSLVRSGIAYKNYFVCWKYFLKLLSIAENFADEDDKKEENEESIAQAEVIDNPYLRPGRIPKLKLSPGAKPVNNGFLSS